MLGPLSLAAGLSWGSGLRLYLTVLIVGVLERLGWVHLPDTLAVLASPWVIGVAAALASVEFLADKIPAVDSLWDAFHTFIRIPAGAVLAAGAVGHADPALIAVAALAGGTLAGAAHLTKAGTRALINLSPEPVSNIVTSSAEDGITVAGVLMSLFAPLLFLVLIVLFLCVAAWALPWLWRGVRGAFSGIASHTSPRLGSLKSLRSRHD